jgi:hypothetical protein
MADITVSPRAVDVLRRANRSNRSTRQEPVGRIADSALVGALALVIKQQDVELTELRRAEQLRTRPQPEVTS